MTNGEYMRLLFVYDTVKIIHNSASGNVAGVCSGLESLVWTFIPTRRSFSYKNERVLSNCYLRIPSELATSSHLKKFEHLTINFYKHV